MYKYQQIIFDADNTLFDFDRAEADALINTLKHFGMPQPPGLLDFYRRMNVGLWQQLENREISIAELKAHRATRLFEFVGGEADVAAFSGHYLDQLATQPHLLPQVKETLAQLARHCEMAIITNGLARVQKPRFERCDINHHFGTLVISEELGVAKPDPAIFQHTCDLMGWDRTDRVLMVGDNYRCDVQGARDFGMRSCWFNIRQMEHDKQDHHYEIQQFDQLLNVLRG